MGTGAVTNKNMSRRGRLPLGKREARRKNVLLMALEALVEHGYDRVTMADIAKRAGASKETLYAWFGDREGLFATLIEGYADVAAERVAKALESGGNPRAVLTDFADGLLALLTSQQSVALNRAAMTSPELATLLLRSGRHRVGPLVERHLEQLARDGALKISNPANAFRTLYGLVVRDTQIRVLLNDSPPDTGTPPVKHAVTRLFSPARLSSSKGEVRLVFALDVLRCV